LLLGAFAGAQALGHPGTDVVVPVVVLDQLGMTSERLGQLAEAGLIEYCRGAARQADEDWPDSLDAAKGVALTSQGAALTGSFLVGHGREHAPARRVAVAARGDRPRWDSGARTLYWRGHVVKRLRKAAPNQELLLATFCELGWPWRIDDPLPREAGVEPKERLRESVKSLNRGLQRPSIRFHADGRGYGVTWEPAS
jgi:hypothetical protein